MTEILLKVALNALNIQLQPQSHTLFHHFSTSTCTHSGMRNVYE